MATPTKSPAKKSTPATTEVRKSNVIFLFDKMNYYILGVGILLLMIGYVLMSGGEQAPNEFKESEIYSFRRITLAPIIVVLGYAVIVYGIMKKPVETKE